LAIDRCSAGGAPEAFQAEWRPKSAEPIEVDRAHAVPDAHPCPSLCSRRARGARSPLAELLDAVTSVFHQGVPAEASKEASEAILLLPQIERHLTSFHDALDRLTDDGNVNGAFASDRAARLISQYRVVTPND
jgi:hypothetical protein